MVDGCYSLTFKVETKDCWLASLLFNPLTEGYTTDHENVTGSLNMDCLFGKPGKQALSSINIFTFKILVANSTCTL